MFLTVCDKSHSGTEPLNLEAGAQARTQCQLRTTHLVYTVDLKVECTSMMMMMMMAKDSKTDTDAQQEKPAVRFESEVSFSTRMTKAIKSSSLAGVSLGDLLALDCFPPFDHQPPTARVK